ncbi:uncharacterized protein METZ01_LOCUS460792, partial [marine metagenome]
SFIPTDFVGLNSVISEPLDISTNTVGAEPVLAGGSVVTWDQDDYPYQGGLIYQSTLLTPRDGFPTVLNALLLHRNGPYGWPTWKQWRHNDHPIIKQKRKNNILDYYSKRKEFVETEKGKSPSTKEVLLIIPYSESAVVSRYRPVNHLVSQNKPGEAANPPIAIQSTYGNNLCTFSNISLNNELNFYRNGGQMFNTIYEMYSNLGDSSTSPIGAFLKFKYREIVFPSELNMYRAKVRGRTNYAEASGSADFK